MIDDKLSINAAAKELKMSYRKAWMLINDMNQMTEKPIVVTNIGGIDGGGTQLTDYGKKLIENFETINSNCIDYLEKEFQKLAI